MGLQNARLLLQSYHSQRSSQLLQGYVNIKGLIVLADPLLLPPLLNEDHVMLIGNKSACESGSKVVWRPLSITQLQGPPNLSLRLLRPFS
jgi:hypothetical protein